MLQSLAGFVSRCLPHGVLFFPDCLTYLQSPILRPQSSCTAAYCIVSAAAPPCCAAETLVNAWELQLVLVLGEGGQPNRAGVAAEACCGQQVSAAPAPEVAACNSAALHQTGPGSIQHYPPAPEMQQVPVSAGLAINR